MEERLLKLKTVLSLVEISRSKLYMLLSVDEFPKPIKIGGTNFWKFSELQNFIQKKSQELQGI